MNKRQLKKKNKKRITVIADEFNLLTMDKEELKEAWKEYDKFVRRYTYRKKYKNLKGKYLNYFFPANKTFTDHVKRMRSLPMKMFCVQTMDDINVLNSNDLRTIVEKGKEDGKSPYKALKEAGYIKNPKDEF